MPSTRNFFIDSSEFLLFFAFASFATFKVFLPKRKINKSRSDYLSRADGESHTHEGLLPMIDLNYERIRGMSLCCLKEVCNELRIFLVSCVFVTGGHLGGNLGAVELTVALHAIFSFPKDKLIFDVGHQSYPHKILTGRKNSMYTIRQGSGLSGFTKRTESEFDPFGAGHASTAISAAVGFAISRDLLNEDFTVIAVAGDGAFTGGLSFEALNHAGGLKLKKFIVILNDNDQVSLPTIYNHVKHPVGALSKSFREESTCGFFESLGFCYLGPFDGHDIEKLTLTFSGINDRFSNGEVISPLIVHLKTMKGKGFAPAEFADDKLHAISPGTDRECVHKSPSLESSFSDVFVDALISLAEKDPKIVAITAAMPGGTGLHKFGALYPNRFLDTGICEAHAVTSAGGMSAGGLKPFVCIYSTFLQRAYDSIVHDVALQSLPVRFVLDRAGLVGADGATHQGLLDIAYLRCIPGVVLCAPADQLECIEMTQFMADYDSGPIFMRFPRGIAETLNYQRINSPLQLGKGRLVFDSGFGIDQIAILSYGARLGACLEAVHAFSRDKGSNVGVKVIDARWAKPLDNELILEISKNANFLITVEEGGSGGFGSAVVELLASVEESPTVRIICTPDRIFEHDSQKNQREEAGIDTLAILNALNDYNTCVVSR